MAVGRNPTDAVKQKKFYSPKFDGTTLRAQPSVAENFFRRHLAFLDEKVFCLN